MDGYWLVDAETRYQIFRSFKDDNNMTSILLSPSASSLAFDFLVRFPTYTKAKMYF